MLVIKQGLADLSTDLALLRSRSIPYALANSMTVSANAALAELKTETTKRLHRPTTWTLNSVFKSPARVSPAALSVRFGFKDKVTRGTAAGEYLNPLVAGGQRPLKPVERLLDSTSDSIASGSAIIPVDSTVNQNGNLPLSKYRHLVVNLNNTKEYFVGKPGASTATAVYKRIGGKRKGKVSRGFEKVFILLPRKPRYNPMLPVPQILEDSFWQAFKPALDEEIRKELEVYAARAAQGKY